MESANFKHFEALYIYIYKYFSNVFHLTGNRKCIRENCYFCRNIVLYSNTVVEKIGPDKSNSHG